MLAAVLVMFSCSTAATAIDLYDRIAIVRHIVEGSPVSALGSQGDVKTDSGIILFSVGIRHIFAWRVLQRINVNPPYSCP